MRKQTFKTPGGKALLDLVSYGRGGPNVELTPTQVEHIRRTVLRVPEVMVKVLNRGSGDLKAVARHLDYLQRHGKLSLETDEGERLAGRAGNAMLADWDLDIDDIRRRNELVPTNARKAPKLVYKLMFSMPAGTPPEKVLEAVRNLAREEFALKHRYALLLHTDAPHPHVHMVVKALSEQGVRLNIRKATLRHWRSEFARHLRALGVAANATERAVRGESQKALKDGIYRAARRGDSAFMRTRVEGVARELRTGTLSPQAGKETLTRTRQAVTRGWESLIDLLSKRGHRQLATDARVFVSGLSAPSTDRERIAHAIREKLTQQRKPSKTR